MVVKIGVHQDEYLKRPIAVVRPVPYSNEQINNQSEVSGFKYSRIVGKCSLTLGISLYCTFGENEIQVFGENIISTDNKCSLLNRNLRL